jgi:hypothetical protein
VLEGGGDGMYACMYVFVLMLGGGGGDFISFLCNFFSSCFWYSDF